MMMTTIMGSIDNYFSLFCLTRLQVQVFSVQSYFILGWVPEVRLVWNCCSRFYLQTRCLS